MDFESIKIYRMTHIDNISHILQKGITHKNSPNHNPLYAPIGDESLINTRNTKKVKVDNGDYSDLNSKFIILGDFIPFYFGVKMPMLYVIQHGGNFVKKPTPASEIVYLVCSLSKISKDSHDYYFSDGHGTDSLSSYYDSSKVKDLNKILDWDAIKASYWGGNDNLNTKRKKQAEFLISKDVSPNFIIGFGCYNDISKGKLISLGINNDNIKIIPNAYY
jgi:ssDNA thymidine ADP-ribosyltransferase, DarT